MPILVDCSKCGTRLQAPENTAVRCPKCGVIIPARGASAPPAPPQLPPAAPATALLDLGAGQAVCVHCHGRMVYDGRVAGRTVACPQCRKPLLMPTLPTNAAPPPVPPPMPAPPLITKAAPPPTPAAEPVLRSHYRRRPGSDTTANTLGGVALLLAVAAFAFALVPRWSWLCVPLSALAVLLGVGGGVVALMRGGRALGLPVSGTVIGAAALVVGLFFLRAIAELMGTAPKAKVTAPGKDDDWVDASKSKVRKDTVKVEVKEARLGAIRIPDVRPEDTPKGEFLRILLEIENVSEINALDYRSWGDATKAAGEKNAARLKDNLGRTYRRVSFGEETRPDGQLIREKIEPDMTVPDVLVFEAPKEDAEYLLLELPSSAYGGIGALRLKIPADMIKR
jgi:DNA-directed RNA polymerase subunit RPC12/RpoP